MIHDENDETAMFDSPFNIELKRLAREAGKRNSMLMKKAKMESEQDMKLAKKRAADVHWQAELDLYLSGKGDANQLTAAMEHSNTRDSEFYDTFPNARKEWISDEIKDKIKQAMDVIRMIAFESNQTIREQDCLLSLEEFHYRKLLSK